VTRLEKKQFIQCYSVLKLLRIQVTIWQCSAAL